MGVNTEKAKTKLSVILSSMDKQVLFICTGNYYRSRYAELFFNDLALKMGIDWRAISRGLAADQMGNIGPISIYTLQRLKLRGISISIPIRLPMQLEERDLLEADLSIALDQRDHQPMMDKQFPAWADRITYWNIPDLNIMDAETALSEIEEKIHTLIEDIRSSPGIHDKDY